jgi:peptide/nickel transport system substrate-binding protein
MKVFKRSGGAIVGAGPFKLERFTGNVLEASRAPTYRGPFGGGGVERLFVRYVIDDTTRYQMLLRGDANMILNGLSPTKTDFLRGHAPPRIQIVDSPGINYSYLCFNFRDARLSNLKVRQAIAHAIDYESILEHRVKGLGYRATGILSPAHADYYEPAVEHYEFDPAKAEKLLDEAGYPRRGPGGWRFPLTFKTTSERLGNEMARTIAYQLRDVGIDMRLQIVEPGTFWADLKAKNFQIFQSRWAGVSNPSIYFRALHSSQASNLNRGSYSNPELDALIDKGMVETSDVKRREIFSKVQKLVARELPYVSLWHWNNTFIGTRDMDQVVMYPNGDLLTIAKLGWKAAARE